MSSQPKAVVEVTAESKSLGAKLREARAKFSKFGGELKKDVFGKDLAEKGFFSKGGAQLVGNLGASALQAVGSFAVEQGKDVLDFNDKLKRLEITANSTPEAMAAFARSVRSTSSAVGIGAKDILDGAASYVALTGDMDGAARASGQWARVAQATNSTVSDIAGTAAALKQQLDIKPEQMEQAFSSLAAQGKAGAIELKDLAAQLGSIAPQWAEFAGGKGINGVRQLGAALQIVKRGFGGDASETVTGLQSLLNALIKNEKNLRKGGVKIFEKDPATGVKSLRNVLDIVNDIGNSKLAKDPTKLEKAFGRVEAYRAYLQLKNNRAELDKMVEVGNDSSLIQRDLAKYNTSEAGKMRIAWQKAKNEIAESFTPERIDNFTNAAIGAAKAAAVLAGTMATILATIEGIGTWTAKKLFGESEEDKALKAQARTRDKRLSLAMIKLAANGDLKGLDSEQIMDKAVAYIAEEDRFASQLAKGKRINGPSPAQYAPKADFGSMNAFIGQFDTGPGQLVRAATDTYSNEELTALSRQLANEGLTNINLIQKLIAESIAQQTAAQNEFLRKFGDAQPNSLKINLGDDSIMNVSRGAPQNSSRPAP